MLQIMYPPVINRKEQICSISFICSLFVIQSMLWDLPADTTHLLGTSLTCDPGLNTRDWKLEITRGARWARTLRDHPCPPQKRCRPETRVCFYHFFPFTQAQKGNIAFLHVQEQKIYQLILRDSGVTALPLSFSLYLREGSFNLDGSYEKGENMSWQY